MRTTLRRLATLFLAGIVLGAGFSVASALASHQFSDVGAGNGYHNDIDWLVDHGIAGGYPDGTFDPTGPVTRAQASRWLRRLNNGLELVVATGSWSATTEESLTATCPTGKRALAITGNTDAFNMLMTDTNLSGASGSVRWETDNNASTSGSSSVRLLCGFTTS